MWDLIETPGSAVAPHWRTLARPSPLPEDEIKADPQALIDTTMASWTAGRDLKPFDRRALAHYRAFVQDPSRIAAMCADYRAGATLDRAADDADRTAGRKIAAPLLAIWGSVGIPAAHPEPLSLWRVYASHAEGMALSGGHFLPEENAADLTGALLDFFDRP
jgi:haloacetate dehalogenase